MLPPSRNDDDDEEEEEDGEKTHEEIPFVISSSKTKSYSKLI